MFKFPFTNFHELNLDWVLSVVKEAKEVFDNGRTNIDYAVQTADEAKEIAQQAVTSVVPDDSVSTQKIKDNAVTASKIENGLLYRPNLLDNWYFVRGAGSVGAFGSFPVNQKRQASYVNAGITVDRVRNVSGSGILFTTAQGLQFSNSDNSNSYFAFLGQDVPTWMPVTVSVLTDIGLISIKSGGNPTVLPSGILVYIDTNTNRLTLRIPGNLNQSNSETFKAAKVEIGDIQTLAHKVGANWVLNEIPDYGESLAKCQKYLFDSGGVLQRLKPSFVSSDTLDFFIPLPVSGANSPSTTSITTLLNNSILIKNSSGTTQSDFTCSLSGITANGLSLRFTKTNHGLNSDCFLEIAAHTLFDFE